MVLLLAAAAPSFGQGERGVFTGPSILSRGTRPLGRSGGRPINLRFNLTFGASYYGGITPAGLEPGLTLGDDSVYIGNVGFGVAGTRSTPRSTTSGQYQGMVNVLGTRSRLNGLNQQGQLTHQHRLTRRWSAFGVISALTRTNVVNGFNSSPFDQLLPLESVVTPEAEPFDSRLIQGVAGGGFQLQKSSRLNVSFFGGAGLQRRKASALVDSDFYIAGAEAGYRLSSRTSVGATYTFFNVYHRRRFGEAFAHTALGTYNVVLSPRWTLGLGAGLFRLESERVNSVAVDPLITAITGVTSALQVSHVLFNGLAAQAALNGSFRTSNLSFSYARGANPGNGFILSGQAERINAQYSYSGLSRTTLTAFAFRANFLPVLLGPSGSNRYRITGTGVSGAYRLSSFLHVIGSAQLLDSQSLQVLNRKRYALTVGIGFQPGEVPLVLW
jgi:hypothetical protein